jgi:chromatin remodeling complex protein RSC6
MKSETIKKKIKRKMNDEQKNRIDKTKGIYACIELSDELCEFLNLSLKSKKSRQDVTKMMFAYIKEKGLQDDADGRKIIMDDDMQKLFNIKTVKCIDMFEMQKYLSKHFMR